MNLDTLVATEGMGWPAGYNFGNDGQSFTPSTNIAHAHMFRDKVLAEHKGDWKIDVAHTFQLGTGVEVCEYLGPFVSWQVKAQVRHDSEPTALCLALLRAEKKVSEERIKEALDGKA